MEAFETTDVPSDVPMDDETLAYFKSEGYVQCPSCASWLEPLPPSWMTGVPELDRTPPAGVHTRDAAGRMLSREQALDAAKHSFRCPGCATTFCSNCRAMPYHLGAMCEEYAAPRCVLCEAAPRSGAVDAPPPTIAEARSALAAAGVRVDSMLEKEELSRAFEKLRAVCVDPACRETLRDACMKRLECGHWCAGVADEASCIGCLQPGCTMARLGAASAPKSEADLTCAHCFDALRSGPSLALRCGHLCHRACALAALEAKYPGPGISLAFLQCPLCRGSGTAAECCSRAPDLDHPSLGAPLGRGLELRDGVQKAAKRRLRVADAAERREVEPGGAYDGRLLDYAMAKWSFYECSECKNVFCGGAQRCGDGAGRAARRLCERCASVGHVCAKHGTEHLIWKCKYCCSPATFFCWGTTHFCDSCHAKQESGGLTWTARACTDARSCPLGVRHPAHPSEMCLGCGMCASGA